jgi:hypothetical protein
VAEPEKISKANEAAAKAASDAVLAGSAAILRETAKPNHYLSDERGDVPIKSMDPHWARNAAKAVREGRRPANPPSVIPALEQRGRQGT